MSLFLTNMRILLRICWLRLSSERGTIAGGGAAVYIVFGSKYRDANLKKSTPLLTCTTTVTTIQITYRVDQIEEGNPCRWDNNLGQIRFDHNLSIVDKAFTILKEGENPEGADINDRNMT